MLRSIFAFAFAIAIHPVLFAEKLPKPDHVPAPATPEQATVIRQGVALHDEGDYPAAIAKYKEVLNENPWEVHALHELSYSYFASRDYAKSLETARLGARCRSQLLVAFYQMIGNSLDELGKSKEAIETYEAAIKMNPEMALLRYNFALTLRRAGKQAEAKAEVETALHYDPNHASSHALLAELYRDMGYKIPAILAYSRFLDIEPDSARAPQNRQKLFALLTNSVSKDTKTNNVTILMSPPSKKLADEGDFGPAELMVSMLLAADLMPPEKAKGDGPKKPENAFEKLVSIYSSLGESLESSAPRGGFAASFYAPYFAALEKQGHTEAFVARIAAPGDVQGVSEWSKQNDAKTVAFFAWSKTWTWPAN